MYQTLPKTPVMLLSFINMKLRDEYNTLDELCDALNLAKQELCDKLSIIDYHYVESENQFK
jgi:hypothetical protein